MTSWPERRDSCRSEQGGEERRAADEPCRTRHGRSREVYPRLGDREEDGRSRELERGLKQAIRRVAFMEVGLSASAIDRESGLGGDVEMDVGHARRTLQRSLHE